MKRLLLAPSRIMCRLLNRRLFLVSSGHMFASQAINHGCLVVLTCATSASIQASFLGVHSSECRKCTAMLGQFFLRFSGMDVTCSFFFATDCAPDLSIATKTPTDVFLPSHLSASTSFSFFSSSPSPSSAFHGGIEASRPEPAGNPSMRPPDTGDPRSRLAAFLLLLSAFSSPPSGRCTGVTGTGVTGASRKVLKDGCVETAPTELRCTDTSPFISSLQASDAESKCVE